MDSDVEQAIQVCRALVSEGHACHGFSERHALLSHLRRQKFNLLILDFNPVDTAGKEVLNWVRQSSTCLPAIFLANERCEVGIALILNKRTELVPASWALRNGIADKCCYPESRNRRRRQTRSREWGGGLRIFLGP